MRDTFQIGMIALAFVASCASPERQPAPEIDSSQETSSSSTIHHYFSKEVHHSDTEWDYSSGPRGPRRWGSLSPEFEIADIGRRQSPIDLKLESATGEDLPPLRFEYHRERMSAIHNGHTIQHDDQPGSFLYLGESAFGLEQFHFHLPSEHTIDGHHAEMEIHFVHQTRSGEVAVLAVLAEPGTEDAVSLPLFGELPTHSGERVEAENVFRSPIEFIPKNDSYVTYSGSFTTPPCTEDVLWIVMTTPIQIRAESIAEFEKSIGGANNRPVQPLFDRTVSYGAESRQP